MFYNFVEFKSCFLNQKTLGAEISKYSRQRSSVRINVLPLLAMVFAIGMAVGLNAQVSGIVFRDIDADGLRDSTTNLRKEVGEAGITVTATNAAGASVTAVTNAFGKYIFPNSGVTAAGAKLRVEFSGFRELDFTAPTGAINTKTSVQFITAGGTGSNQVDLGILYPRHYVVGTPDWVGNRMVTTGADEPTLKRALMGSPNQNGGTTTLARSSEVGTVMGMSYSPQNAKLYTAAFVKRQAYFGPGGIGAIYETANNSNGPSSVWLDLAAAGVNVGTMGVRGGDDLDAMNSGKIGLGGLSLSEDGAFMYVMNLNERKLIEINTATKAIVGQYSVPAPTYTFDGTYRFNVQGESFTDQQGRYWSAGNAFFKSGFTAINIEQSNSLNGARSNNNTLGTTDGFLYSSAAIGSNFQLEVPVQNGSYTIKIHTRTNDPSNGTNMEFMAEGITKVSGYSTFTSSGGTNQPDVISFTSTVTDGVLDIDINGQGAFFFCGYEVIPDVAQSQVINEFRPFAVKAYRGDVYIGGVISAETSQRISDMQAMVYKFNTTTKTFDPTPVLSYALNYPKGYAWNGVMNMRPPVGAEPFYGVAKPISGWYPWIPQLNYAKRGLDAGTGNPMVNPSNITQPQPVLTDIEFDENGDMLIVSGDRMTNMVHGSFNEVNPSEQMIAIVGGDLLRAARSGSTYTLENNGSVGGRVSATGVNNGEGPGGGEFYNVDSQAGAHTENSKGGAAVVPGWGESLVTQMDASSNITTVGSAGVAYVSNFNGSIVRSAFMLYLNVDPSNFGKGTGLGDVEVLTSPPPVEIGNLVWLDTDGDGTQDADENGIPGVTVQLMQSSTVIATAQTDANGNYFFSSAAGTSTPSSIFGIAALVPNAAYTVHFPTTATVSSVTYNLTTVNAGSGNDQIDSDASNTGDISIAANSVPLMGASNHTFDVGYRAAATCIISSVTATPGACAPATNQYTVTGAVNFSDAPATGTLTVQITGGGSQVFNAPFTSPLNYSIASQTSDGASHTVTATFSDDVACTNNVNYTAPASCQCIISSVTATPGACAPATNQYTVTGAVTFTNAPASGTLTVQITGGGSQVFNAPFTSPLNYSIASQTSDGASHTVTAAFSAGPTCTNTANYTAPASCQCNISSLTATPGSCAIATNQYTVTGAVTFTNAPATGTLTVQIAGGGSQVFNAPFTSPLNYSIANQTSDGASHTVTATFSADAGCTQTANYTAPAACQCNISSLTATPGACAPATNQYTLTGVVTFINAPATGTLTVQITGGGSQVFNAPFSSPLNYSIASQTSDGVSHTVTASFSADAACTRTANYTAPANCLCSISSVTATPGLCAPATNHYTVTGAITFVNPPATGTLTVQITGGGSQVFNAPFTSPLNYSIASQTSDGAPHTVTATFSAMPACSQTANYTAPAPCKCTVTGLSANPGACSPVVNTYSLTGTVTYVAPPATGTLVVTVVGAGSQTFNAPFLAPINYSFSGLNSDGANHSVIATFSADAACTQTVYYTAPSNCTACPSGNCATTIMVKN